MVVSVVVEADASNVAAVGEVCDCCRIGSLVTSAGKDGAAWVGLDVTFLGVVEVVVLMAGAAGEEVAGMAGRDEATDVAAVEVVFCAADVAGAAFALAVAPRWFDADSSSLVAGLVVATGVAGSCTV